jgi:two-component system, OmpR family, KDP operon response regulator KdpE
VVTPTPLNILVVDDESPLRETLRQSFTREGHTVMAVPDGRSAIDRASTTRFDIVLLDIALGAAPDGFEVCRELRARDNVVPIIMLTALDSEAEAVLGLEAGADDYVTKPFGPRELLARLDAALRRAGGETEEPVIEADGLRIDLAAHAVSREGEEIHLTPIEFELLATLARNRGRLMTHRALLKEVWGPAYADDSQTLRTHIANLRRKIGPRVIRTDPGVGYRFAA